MTRHRNTRKSDEQVYEAPSRSNHSNKGHKKYQSENVVNFKTFVEQRKSVTIIPKSVKQEEYVEMLLDPTKLIVFAMGPAGTGKTMLGVLAAIKALKEGDVEKIVITRPAVEVEGEKHGFLPGTLEEKLAPWMIPIFDVFKEYYSVRELTAMMEDEIIEIAPLGMMRGRTFKNAFIIADEMQNASPTQLLMLLTRIGDGSKMVITGDLRQRDKQFIKENGLSDFFEKFEGYRGNSISKV